MDEEWKRLMKIFEEEYEKKRTETESLDSHIAKLNMRKKQIVFETLDEAKARFDKERGGN